MSSTLQSYPKTRKDSLLRRLFPSKPNDGETAMLIAYLLPFSYSPVFLLSALTNLDKKSFPRLGRRIAGTLQSRIENGSDPLTALEETSNIIGGNTIIGQLLQSYVRITRTVGQASYATLVFFERAIKAIESSWSKFTMASKVLAEAYIG
ncbi:MAG: hypothetical protein F7C32_03095, partial [Desulfurococcales archaeon]|nr:hypothetical protein [Desulfurococcales archaeon]